MPRLSAALRGSASEVQPAPAQPAEAQLSWAPQPLALGLPPPPNSPLLSRVRRYRQPDGSLSDVKPPPEPYTVAARRDWADLVRYARVTGGCREATDTGVSFRYGIGVSAAQHRAYLQSIGLPCEVGDDGAAGMRIA
jgi:hypothetical protein